MSLFSIVEQAPRDPILGLNEAYQADPRSEKVNLGVGVYYDEAGKVPLLAAVRAAEQARLAAQPPRSYQPIDGAPAYNTAVQKLLFGADASLLAEQRVVTAQALGGTGALRIGADFLKQHFPDAGVFISDPSWENHRAIFEAAGFTVDSYPYYDATTRSANVVAMMNALAVLPANSIVLLHACCHNPTGADLDASQWQGLAELCRERGLIPFLDIAYQGFADGIEADSVAVQTFAATGLPFLVASSFSKNFSLYGERVGALSIVTASADEAKRVQSQVKRVIRSNYSNPPTHGGAIVSAVLGSSELRAQWESELGQMRDRIRRMRETLVARLAEVASGQDFSFITAQRGMFSYTGLTTAQVDAMKNEFGIYAVGTGRICLAALNDNNIDHVAKAIASVIKSA